MAGSDDDLPGSEDGLVHVVLVTAGSRGDVAPYAGLGRALVVAGHAVTLATHASFRPLADQAGLRFVALPGDPREQLATDEGRAWQTAGSGWRAQLRLVGLLRPYAARMAAAVGVALEGADVAIVSALTSLAVHEAQARGIPTLGAYLQPLDPTREFPSVVSGRTRSLGPLGNRLSTEVVRLGITVPFMGIVNRIRADHDLQRQSAPAMFRRLARDDWPVLHGVSRHLVPRPRDWRPGLQVVGPWWPVVDPAWSPPERLTAFLDAGDPPVLVGFGSMSPAAGSRLTELAVEALGRAGVRGVVQAGWAGLGGENDSATTMLTDDVLAIGEAPHAWLMPRVRAVVHHAGAGTTHAAVRHAIPAVPVPVLADQPFWADRLRRAGVATAPIPFSRLTIERLADAVREVTTTPAYAARARELAALVAQEDGAAAVVTAVETLADGVSRGG